MKFLVDRTLGKLVKGLRMLGYDTAFDRGEDAYLLIRSARDENRILLTRDTKLRPIKPEDQVVLITENNPSLQLKGLLQRGVISIHDETLLSRCLECNGLLSQIPREEAEGRVPDFIFYHQEAFFRCPHCQKIYWKGSHHQNMERKLQELVPETA